MNWVEFEGVTFNLDHVTHFDVISSLKDSEVRAYLNIGYPRERIGVDDYLEHQAYITVAKGTQAACENCIKEIIAGKHNLPSKGHLYPIREHLNTMNINLEKISENVELLAQKQ